MFSRSDSGDESTIPTIYGDEEDFETVDNDDVSDPSDTGDGEDTEEETEDVSKPAKGKATKVNPKVKPASEIKSTKSAPKAKPVTKAKPASKIKASSDNDDNETPAPKKTKPGPKPKPKKDIPRTPRKSPAESASGFAVPARPRGRPPGTSTTASTKKSPNSSQIRAGSLEFKRNPDHGFSVFLH